MRAPVNKASRNQAQQKAKAITEPGAVATGSHSQPAIDDLVRRKTRKEGLERLHPVATARGSVSSLSD